MAGFTFVAPRLANIGSFSCRLAWSARPAACWAALLAGILGGAHVTAQTVSESPDPMWQSYRAHIAAAQAWLELNEPGRAREWVDRSPAAYRGWEWRHLQSQLEASLGVLLSDEAGIMSIAVAPDGKMLAGLTGSGKLSLIALPEGNVVRSWDAHPDVGGFTVRFSPDGVRIASSGADRLVKIWEVASGTLTLAFDQHKFPVGGLSWSPDGTRIASSAYYLDKQTPIEGRVHIWTTTDGAIVHTLTTGQKPVVCTDWSRDGRFIAAGTWDSAAVIWSAEDGVLVRTLDERPGPDSASHVDALSLSPDGELIAYGSSRKWVRVHRIVSGEKIAELASHGQPISSVQFSPDGTVLATGGDDDTIRMWNTECWKELATLHAHHGRVRGLTFAPDGLRLYSASIDGTIRAWDTSVRDTRGLHLRHPTGNYSVSFSPEGAKLAGAGFDGIVPIWNTRTGALEASIAAHVPAPVCLTEWSADGKRLATCSWDKTARVFDVATRKEVLRIEHAGGVAHIAWSPAGDLLATACHDKKAHLWDAETGALVRSFEGHEGILNEVCFSPDAKFLLTAGGDKTARLWDAASGECMRILRGHRGGVHSACWSPDGIHIATSANDGSVRLWRAATGECTGTLHEGDEPVHRVAFSPDGGRLACAGRELILLDPQRPGATARFRPHEDMIWNIRWSPDGARLASGSWDGTVAILDTISAAERAALAPRRNPSPLE